MTTLELTAISVCSLDAGAAAQRGADFRALLTPSLRALERDGESAVLDLSLGGRGERALAELLRLERECCPFWRFALTRVSARRLRLEVHAETPHEAAIDAFLSLTGFLEPAKLTFRAGEAARRAGVGVETLRYYERRGLLPRPQRRASGQREYTLEDVRLVLAVKSAQRLGFTLAETHEIVRVTRRRGGSDLEGLRERVEAKLREVDGKIRGLELMRRAAGGDRRRVRHAHRLRMRRLPDRRARPRDDRHPTSDGPMSRRIGTGLLVVGACGACWTAPLIVGLVSAGWLGAPGAGWPWMAGAAGTALVVGHRLLRRGRTDGCACPPA